MKWNQKKKMCWFDLFEVSFEIHTSQWIVQKTLKNSINIHDDDDDDYEVFNYTHTQCTYTHWDYMLLIGKVNQKPICLPLLT